MKAMRFHHAGPHLPVKNLIATLTWYRDVLGFYDEWTFGEKDGGIRRDDMRLLFGENPSHVALINSKDNHLPVLWFVENIEDIFLEFKGKGVAIVDPLRDHVYGLKEFAFIDINGYYIRVAERSAT